MSNPYHIILANGTVPEVLQATANANQLEFAQAVETLTEDQIFPIGAWTSHNLRTSGAKHALVEGCLLFLMNEATKTNHEEVFRNVVQDGIGISKTQAYRKIAAWRHFGKTLTRTPELPNQFVCEALLILAAELTAPQARVKALDMAEQGELITIRVAKQLQEEFSQEVRSLDTPTRPRLDPQLPDLPRRDELETQPLLPEPDDWFTFVGKFARIVVNPARDTGQADLQSIIADLEAALDKFRTEFLRQEAAHV